ncbi:MAG TPA: glycogen/starch/alpha-glucan phosphorylase [Rhodopila sp.]|nr:glycogen/starch/alpha-glucan phosphorylase [Rhodopila sp.]
MEFDADTADMTQETVTTSEHAPDTGADEAAVTALQGAILRKLNYHVGKRRAIATERDWLMATAIALRDQIVDRWLAGIDKTYQSGSKRVYYLSLEFLVGRLLFDNLNNLGQLKTMRAALSGLGVDLDRLRALEPDPALGNGGLGRLAACFMESMATLDIPAYGYGIRYDHGLFRQIMKNGWQQEFPEDWLSLGNPWEFFRPEVSYDIGFGGSIEAVPISEAAVRHVWHPAETIEAVAYDTPSVGWRGRRVNTLRLWSARSTDPLLLEAFNHGDHTGALTEQVRAESISKVLYPSDATPAGQELRLRQEYFFVSASLQDLVRRHIRAFGHISSLAEKTSIQLNDTHPAIGVAELMRILLDIHQLPWEEAWRMTQKTFSYTNHTLLPEALESWPVPLMERLLPRHMQIIYLINALHLGQVRQEHPNDEQLLSSVSMIDESAGRRVRMSHLAFLGSHRINGVSALHTNLMRETVFHDLHQLFPNRIVNVTNGIAFRRWLHEANPRLTQLLVNAVGPEVLDNEDALTQIRPLASDPEFQKRYAAARRANKLALADVIRRELEVRVDPASLFDVQIKRIHEYKRQLLNILEAIAFYNAIRARPMDDWKPRVKIFAGKAAASYHQAKLIIKLIHDVAKVVNSDPTVRDVLKIVFLPNYSVSLAEAIIPAADLSEQISTAGMEASGTGNMKFALNGALTIGTMDGANIEIHDRVGGENMFIFGMTADKVAARRSQGLDSTDVITASPILNEVLDGVAAGVFSPDDCDRYRDLVENLRYHDYFQVCADFDDYYATQRRIAQLWHRPEDWWRTAILNTANVGWFSSDRAIREYADLVWNVPTWQGG